jgi:putative transposase
LRDGLVKPSRFTEEQIIGVLREHEAGAKALDLAGKQAISEATLYNWTGHSRPSECRLRHAFCFGAKVH